MKVIIASLMLGLSSPLMTMAASAPAASTQATIRPADARSVVAEVRRQIAANYVLVASRPAIDNALRRGLESGRYDVSDPNDLAQRINADLSNAAHDKHLNIQFDPKRAAMIAGNQGDEVRTGPAWERDAQMRNHGIITMRMIPGNIRYIAYDRFTWTGPKSAEAIDLAMRFLKEGDAAIIDLTSNGGGSPLAVQYLVSHFMAPNRPLVTFHMGWRSEPDRRSTLAELPAGRMVGKPLYVLISEHTGSAAEEFAGHVAGFKLGELVGATTGGAAFRNDLFDAGHGFVLSVSVGRPVLTSTGDDWEGKGIAPTIAVAAANAQDAAVAHALRRIASTAAPEDKADYERRAEVLWARAKPVAPALPLDSYVGTFGERSVRLENGRLIYERTGGIRSPLVPLGANRFALDEDHGTRVEYAAGGPTPASFDLIRSDGTRVTVARTQ